VKPAEVTRLSTLPCFFKISANDWLTEVGLETSQKWAVTFGVLYVALAKPVK
jgi:hypothetical protein